MDWLSSRASLDNKHLTVNSCNCLTPGTSWLGVQLTGGTIWLGGPVNWRDLVDWRDQLTPGKSWLRSLLDSSDPLTKERIFQPAQHLQALGSDERDYQTSRWEKCKINIKASFPEHHHLIRNIFFTWFSIFWRWTPPRVAFQPFTFCTFTETLKDIWWWFDKIVK